MNENQENITNNEGKKAPDAAPKPAPKKKVSVVFRSQNSTTIKELPRNLRTAADSDRKKKQTVPGAKPQAAPAAKGPRPLPAGTKPVKPAVWVESTAEGRMQVSSPQALRMGRATVREHCPTQEMS